MTLSDLSLAQLERLYRRLHARMTYGMGYQMFGYDWRTLFITNPPLARAMKDVANAIQSHPIPDDDGKPLMF